MIHWCLSVLALKVEKSFDDGGLRLTDKSWMPPPSPLLRAAPHLSYYLVMCSTVIAMVTHCYFISSLPQKFKLKAEEGSLNRGCLLLFESAFLIGLCLRSASFLSGSAHATENSYITQWHVIEQHILSKCSLWVPSA